MSAGSFRDAHGRVALVGDRVFRVLSERGRGDWDEASRSGLITALEARDWVPATRAVPIGEVPAALDASAGDLVLEHDRLPFISYPFEWTFSMLKAAALHHLAVLDLALAHGMTVKDGSAYNVQFVGRRPIFIDVLSFTPEDPRRLWHGHRQFCEHFLFPLMLTARTGAPFQPWLRSRLEGLDVDTLARLLGLRRFVDRDLLFHVVLQRRLVRALATDPRGTRHDLDTLGDLRPVVRRSLRGLGAALRRLRPPRLASAWESYAADCHYAESDRELKGEFVRRHAARLRPRLAWDLGANTGEYSRVVAEHAGYVVAMDADLGALERLWQELPADVGNVQPLVMDVLDPTPAQGWRSEERMGLRERGQPGLVLALGLIHHVVIDRNVPLADFTGWLASAAPALIVEFVTKDDPKARLLLRDKDDQYDEYDASRFEELLSRTHAIVERRPLPGGTRILYAAERGSPVTDVGLPHQGGPAEPRGR